jgi:hypothetical protein
MRAAAYVPGDDGRNQCPTRYYRIVNEAACQSAATACVGALDVTTVSEYAYPSGCFSLQGRVVYLNTHPTGSDLAGARLLCSGATLLRGRPNTLRSSPIAVATGVLKGYYFVLLGTQGCCSVLTGVLKGYYLGVQGY